MKIISTSTNNINRTSYLVKQFMLQRGLTEAYIQHNTGVLAFDKISKTTHCPSYMSNEKVVPLPHTNKIALDKLYLDNIAYFRNSPDEFKGVFTHTTSYRDGYAMPMIEYVLNANISITHSELMIMLGFDKFIDKSSIEYVPASFAGSQELASFFASRVYGYRIVTYSDIANRWRITTINDKNYDFINEYYGKVAFLKYAPHNVSPCWTVSKNSDYVHSLEVIVNNTCVITAIEKSTCPDEMRTGFNMKDNGKYKEIMYNLFGEARVESELESYFNRNMTPRISGTIDMLKLTSAMEKYNILV